MHCCFLLISCIQVLQSAHKVHMPDGRVLPLMRAEMSDMFSQSAQSAHAVRHHLMPAVPDANSAAKSAPVNSELPSGDGSVMPGAPSSAHIGMLWVTRLPDTAATAGTAAALLCCRGELLMLRRTSAGLAAASAGMLAAITRCCARASVPCAAAEQLPRLLLLPLRVGLGSPRPAARPPQLPLAPARSRPPLTVAARGRLAAPFTARCAVAPLEKVALRIRGDGAELLDSRSSASCPSASSCICKMARNC